MRRCALLVVLPLLASARLGGQAFEGTVTIKMDQTDPNSLVDSKIFLKGTQFALVGTTGPGSMAGPGAEIRIIIDWPTNKSTVLLPLVGQMAQIAQMMPNAKGLKIIADIPAGASSVAGSLTALGTTQTIAGFVCKNYVETGTKEPRNLCLTEELGRFIMPSMGGRGRGGAGPSWAALIGDKGFPLKVWSAASGKVDIEVTAVQRGPVPASTFVIPEGYVDLNAIMGGRGRGGF